MRPEVTPENLKLETNYELMLKTQTQIPRKEGKRKGGRRDLDVNNNLTAFQSALQAEEVSDSGEVTLVAKG